ncbi:MAG: hypothetical protein IJ274_05295 [Lachnospiraceae bacterium]|nr:hypothetical protein [Lachnospiraceae bacterium]
MFLKFRVIIDLENLEDITTVNNDVIGIEHRMCYNKREVERMEFYNVVSD